MPAVTVHLAVYDTMADWEVGHAIAHVNSPDGQVGPLRRVVTVGPDGADRVLTMGGVTIRPDMPLGDLEQDASAMLILPGASSWDAGENGAFAAAAGRLLAAGVPVAAICGATAGLARAGLLDERPHTSNAPEYLAATGYAGAAHYRDAPAVADGDLITAGALAPVEFAHAVLARLEVYPPPVLAAWLRLFADRDPGGFAEMADGA